MHTKLTKSDQKLLMHLRQDGRKRVTRIADEERIPVTTVYDRLRCHTGKTIRRITSLLDFSDLGYGCIVHIVAQQIQPGLRELLLSQPNVNSLYRVNGSQRFRADCIFTDRLQQHRFLEDLQRHADIQVFEEIEELRREAFLTKPEHW